MAMVWVIPTPGERSPASCNRSSSSAFSTLVLVALVLGLAGAILVMAGALGAIVPDPNHASFDYGYVDNGSADVLVVTHAGGNRLDGEQLMVVIEGAAPTSADGSYAWAGADFEGEASVTAGDAVTVDPSTIGAGTMLDLDWAEVSVIRHPPETDRSFVIARWEGPERGHGGRPETSSDSVTTVDESETIGGDRKLYFHVAATEEVTVTGFALTTKTDGDMAAVESLGGSGNDVVVDPSSGDTEGVADDSGAGFTTDGTPYTLDVNATVAAGGTANVTLSDFQHADGSTYSFAPGEPEFRARGGPWDVAVTVVFRDGSYVTVFIDVP